VLGKGVALGGVAGCRAAEISLAAGEASRGVGGMQRARTLPPQGGFGEGAPHPGSVGAKGWYLAGKPGCWVSRLLRESSACLASAPPPPHLHTLSLSNK